MDMDIAFRLRAWRAYRERTLQDVADRCELTKGAISLGERGLRKMYVKTLQAIVTKGLDTTMERFFGALPPDRPLPSPDTDCKRCWDIQVQGGTL